MALVLTVGAGALVTVASLWTHNARRERMLAAMAACFHAPAPQTAIPPPSLLKYERFTEFIRAVQMFKPHAVNYIPQCYTFKTTLSDMERDVLQYLQSDARPIEARLPGNIKVAHVRFLSTYGSWNANSWLHTAMELPDDQEHTRIANLLPSNQQNVMIIHDMGGHVDRCTMYNSTCCARRRRLSAKPSTILVMSGNINAVPY